MRFGVFFRERIGFVNSAFGGLTEVAEEDRVVCRRMMAQAERLTSQ